MRYIHDERDLDPDMKIDVNNQRKMLSWKRGELQSSKQPRRVSPCRNDMINSIIGWLPCFEVTKVEKSDLLTAISTGFSNYLSSIGYPLVRKDF